MADKEVNVYQKLAKVQQTLIAPKNQFNKFGGYAYRSCEDILEGLKPCLKDVGAVVTVEDNLVNIGDRFYIEAIAHFISTDDGTEITNTAYARESLTKKGMDDSQVTGSTSSYARKYALNGLFAIDDVKDADSRDNSEDADKKTSNKKSQPKAESKPETKAEPKNDTPDELKRLINDDELKHIQDELARTQIDVSKILGTYKIKDLKEMSATQFISCKHKLSITPTKEEK